MRRKEPVELPTLRELHVILLGDLIPAKERVVQHKGHKAHEVEGYEEGKGDDEGEAAPN